MTLDVLNCRGTDRTQDFSAGPGKYDPRTHPPINYHAYAACMRGRFASRISDVRSHVLLLLLRGNLANSLRAARKLAKKCVPFLISWKEAGRHQVAQSLAQPRILTRFHEISSLASGFLAATPWLDPFYQAAAVGLTLGKFIPTPYPVDFAEWDFRLSPEKRTGIFLGTREFLVPSRNHAVAVFLACRLGERLRIPVTCINTEGRRGRALLQRIDTGRNVLRIVEGCLPYGDYLKLIAQHRIVWQCDRSGAPGQVAGDAMLCGVPSIGGDGAIDSILSPTGQSQEYEASLDYAHRLLTDSSFYREATEALRHRALESLSFHKIAQILRDFLQRLT